MEEDILNSLYLPQVRMINRGFYFFMSPSDMIGDVDTVPANIEYRQNVGFYGIPNHHEFIWFDVKVSNYFWKSDSFFSDMISM